MFRGLLFYRTQCVKGGGLA